MKTSLLFLIILSKSAFALETDQFIASKTVIQDSANVLNKYFEKQIEKAITSANKNNPEKIKCTDVADKVMDNLVGAKYLGISKISQYAKKSPEIDIFPDRTISDNEYFKMTFYENADFLLKLAPLARTINVNGIYMGTDKLGHFSLIGRNYYHNYLSNLKDGMKKNDAKKAAMLKGFGTEKGLLGYAIGGVLSFGDLEANFEGMQFAIDICDGENPYIKFENNQFIRNSSKDFNTKYYFNPRMDESFLFSFWRPGLYKRINEKLAKEWCETKNDPMYLDRISNYPAIVPNLNDQLIKEYLLTINKFDRKLEDVESFCKK